MTCLSCGARWSRKTGQNDISGKDGADSRSTSIDTTLPRMCLGDATTKDDKQNGDVLRMQSVSLVQKSGTRISNFGITCFTVCAFMFSSSAYGGAGDGTGLRFSRIGRELHNAGCFSRTSCDTKGATIPVGTATASCLSSGITGQEARRAVVRMFPDQQQKVKVSKAARTLQDTMQKI